MFESPARHHHSVRDGCGNDIGTGEDCDWRLLRSRARIRSAVARESFVGHIRSWTINGSITLLLMARGHTASLGSQISLHYGEACPPATCLPASQLRTLLQNTHHTPYTKHQDSANVRAFIPYQYQQHTLTHLAAATIHQSLFNQLINGACMDQWESWFGIWNDEDVIFCCFCGQLLWIWHLLSVCQARCGSTLLRRRVFRAFVAYLLNQAVNLTHVSFLS